MQVQARGFRTVQGNASQTYTTPTLINISKFDAVTGTEEGSAILTFTTEGGNSAQTGSWNITYYAEGEEEKTISCTGNTATVTGLTLGKEYTFQILPQNNETITGSDGKALASYKWQKGRKSFNKDKFALEHPDLYKQYSYIGDGTRVLRLSRGGK